MIGESRFKGNVHRFGVADAWYAFRDEHLVMVARQWADENGISLVP